MSRGRGSVGPAKRRVKKAKQNLRRQRARSNRACGIRIKMKLAKGTVRAPASTIADVSGDPDEGQIVVLEKGESSTGEPQPSRSNLESSQTSSRPRIRSLNIETSQRRVATMRICAQRGVIRIIIRELLMSSDKNHVVLGEGSDFLIRQQRNRCQRHRLEWEEFEQVRGVGVHRIELRVIDQTGRVSKARRHSYEVID